MRLSETASATLMMTDHLRSIAIQQIKEMCIMHDCSMTISSDISIDLDVGYDGVRNCNINAVTYDRAADDVWLRATCIESGESFVTGLLHGDAIEVLEIIANAVFVPKSDFMQRFPTMNLVKEEKDVLEMWELFEDVPVNNDDEIESDFLYWPKGTDKYEIWRWFDEHYSKGIAAIIY